MPESGEVKRYYSHGKLLLTGEYLVLDGALALALPTRAGQALLVKERPAAGPGVLEWNSYTMDGEQWFYGTFELTTGRYQEGSDADVGVRLEQLFTAARRLNPGWWESAAGHHIGVRTELEFPREWGLGTSSTLVANLANWWSVDAHQLLAASFGGSGYDLACASAAGPIFYRREAGRPIVERVPFYPSFSPKLHFVYLEQKQNSRAGIANYRSRGGATSRQLEAISNLSRSLAVTDSLSEFQQLLREHEYLIAEVIGLEPVQDRLFSDFPGSVKSLGAWGGDFVLVASHVHTETVQQYFLQRSYPIVIPYDRMMLPV